MIKPYLRDMINDHKTRTEWKIQFPLQINFISSKDSKETHTIHRKRKRWNYRKAFGIIIIIIIIFYKNQWEEASLFSIVLIYSITSFKKCLKRGGSYIDSPEWLKSKKSYINLKNNADDCFQYALTVALNFHNVKKVPQKISNINL